MRVRMLQRTYKANVKDFELTQKSDFDKNWVGKRTPSTCATHLMSLGYLEEGHEDDDS